MTPGFRRAFILFIILVAIVAVVLAIWNPLATPPETKTWDETYAHLEADEIETLTVKGDGQSLEFTINETVYVSTKEYIQPITELINAINAERAAQTPALDPIQTEVTILPGGNSGWDIFLSWLPLIVIVAFFFFLMRRAGGGAGQAFNFSKSRARMLIGNQPDVMRVNDLGNNWYGIFLSCLCQ